MPWDLTPFETVGMAIGFCSLIAVPLIIYHLQSEIWPQVPTESKARFQSFFNLYHHYFGFIYLVLFLGYLVACFLAPSWVRFIQQIVLACLGTIAVITTLWSLFHLSGKSFSDAPSKTFLGLMLGAALGGLSFVYLILLMASPPAQDPDIFTSRRREKAVERYGSQ